MAVDGSRMSLECHLGMVYIDIVDNCKESSDYSGLLLYSEVKMPYKPKKPCAYPGCPNLTYGRYCEKHKSLENQIYNKYKRDPQTNERYGKDWRKTRASFLKNHQLCELCRREGRITPATMVHHIIPVRNGGSNDEENLMALCKSCHSRLHSKDGSRWGNKR